MNLPFLRTALSEFPVRVLRTLSTVHLRASILPRISSKMAKFKALLCAWLCSVRCSLLPRISSQTIKHIGDALSEFPVRVFWRCDYA